MIVDGPNRSIAVGRRILDEIATIMSKPFVAVVNSDFLGDHWRTNQAVLEGFPNATVPRQPTR